MTDRSCASATSRASSSGLRPTACAVSSTTSLRSRSRCSSHPARTRSSSPDASGELERDRKSTRLNSSHRTISYAVFCLKKKKKKIKQKEIKTKRRIQDEESERREKESA